MPYTDAAICRLGHAVLRDTAGRVVPSRCPMCGVNVIARCLRCNAPVRGPEYALRQGPVPPSLIRVWLPGGYEPPAVCHRCGDRYPWAKHTARERVSHR